MPVDNNAAERVLGAVALGGKKDLFARMNQSAENLAGPYSVISTCEACGVNPTGHIGELLFRTANHPVSKLAALLSHRWQPMA